MMYWQTRCEIYFRDLFLIRNAGDDAGLQTS